MKKATAILFVLLSVCFAAQVFATGSSQSSQTPAGPVTIELCVVWPVNDRAAAAPRGLEGPAGYQG
jgi:hypothetical protein